MIIQTFQIMFSHNLLCPIAVSKTLYNAKILQYDFKIEMFVRTFKLL